jgi:hypothetical protein
VLRDHLRRQFGIAEVRYDKLADSIHQQRVVRRALHAS